MKIISASLSPITGYEVSEILREECEGLSGKSQLLSRSELTRKCFYCSALNYIHATCTTPPWTNETQKYKQRSPFILIPPKLSVEKEKLSMMLKLLHAQFQLSQAELLQIVDLRCSTIVDVVLVIESCGNRFTESQIIQIATIASQVLSQNSLSEGPSEIANLSSPDKLPTQDARPVRLSEQQNAEDHSVQDSTSTPFRIS